MKVKELKEILNECCEDNMEVVLEYLGCDVELTRKDCFKINDYSIDSSCICLEF
jgi:hypothetical protein